MRRRPGLVVFAVALAIRVLYVLQIRDLPWFEVPLVDGANYFNLAATIAAGDLLGGREVFWQPPLYSYLIALIQSIFGTGLLPVYLVQAAIGSVTRAIVAWIGRRLFDDGAGLAAGLVAAFYGPLVHFDAQPLIPVLHVALATAGLLAMLRAAGIPWPSPAPGREWALAGLAWGLAAIATPNILFAVPIVPIWAWRWRRSSMENGGADPASPARGLAIFAVALAIPVIVVAARNLLVAGEPVLISSNGGINFYIGNNPDYERTIRIRPGGEFERLAQEPENLGITGAAAKSRWFASRALAFIGEYPGQAARLYLRKGLDLIAGREIPRNEDAYSYRDTSWILAALLWRWGVSFPFGVVAPLALAGWIAAWSPGGTARAAAVNGPGRRAGQVLLLLYAAAYAASIVIFFPTDRYRLPIVPVLAVLAGAAIAGGGRVWRLPRVLAALVAGLVIFNLDAFRPAEAWPVEEALTRAYALRMQGRQEEAIAEYRWAMALDPRRIDPHNALGAIAAQQGRWEEAARHYETLVNLAPGFVEARRSLGQSYLALGRVADGRGQLEIAVGLAPHAGLALADLCLAHVQEGLAAQGETWCRRAVEARPDLAETHMALGLMARSLRQRDLARHEFEIAARLFPRGSRGRDRAEEILEKMRRRDAGIPAADPATPP